MADSTEGAATAPAEGEPDSQNSDTQGDLGDAGKRALDRERLARKEAEARAKANEDAAAELAKLQEADKSEIEKLNDKANREAEARKRAEAELVRLRVAVRHGLNEDEARRLIGETEEELDADAEELAKLLNKTAGEPEQEEPPVQNGHQRTPAPQLKSGTQQAPPGLNEDALLTGLKSKLGIK